MPTTRPSWTDGLIQVRFDINHVSYQTKSDRCFPRKLESLDSLLIHFQPYLSSRNLEFSETGVKLATNNASITIEIEGVWTGWSKGTRADTDDLSAKKENAFCFYHKPGASKDRLEMMKARIDYRSRHATFMLQINCRGSEIPFSWRILKLSRVHLSGIYIAQRPRPVEIHTCLAMARSLVWLSAHYIYIQQIKLGEHTRKSRTIL